MSKAHKKEDSAIGLDIQLTKSEDFIEKHLKAILIAIVAVVVVVAGYFIYQHHMKGVETEAIAAIAKSQDAFAREQYEQALKGDGANEKGFLKIIDEYSGTKTANLAKLYAALCYVNTNKADEAIRMFEDFKQQDDETISPLSLAALGNTYVEKGDKGKGAEMLVKAAKLAGNDGISPECLFQAAKVYESLNQNDKAVELYKEIKEKYVRSSLATDMDKYIERATK